MNKYFKKFSIMFMMTLILSLGFCISAFASDDGLVGVANLNNTAENSAKIGDKLTQPEIGWKRYDDTDSRITYEGTWMTGSNSNSYNGTYKTIQDTTSIITFKFYGTKLRILNPSNVGWSNNISISIDGIAHSFSQYGSTLKWQVLSFEQLNLSLGVHTIIIQNNKINYGVGLDAIDIDSNGYLLPYNESITLDHSSLSLKTGDSQQLTATTTPAGASAYVGWSSSDLDVARYDLATGKVIAGTKAGTCTITATINDGSNLSATCDVTVAEGTVEPPQTDGTLFIELVDGNIKSYDVTADEITNFIKWYNNRDNDDSQPSYYKFTKGSYKDYVIHDKIDWFEVR